MITLWQSFKTLIWLMFITGIAYPLLITLFAQIFTPEKANGEIQYVNERPVGARLIAQKFENEKYFWPRPSAANYDTLPSKGSNLGPTSQKLKKIVDERKEFLFKIHGHEKYLIPSDLLFSSASGIDPDITLEGAYYQTERVAKARGLHGKEAEVKKLIEKVAKKHSLKLFGPPYVNVLMLNLALDQEFKESVNTGFGS